LPIKEVTINPEGAIVSLCQACHTLIVVIVADRARTNMADVCPMFIDDYKCNGSLAQVPKTDDSVRAMAEVMTGILFNEEFST